MNGNLIQDADGNTYAWDFQNHLTSKNGSAHFRFYDGDGTLVGKTDDGVTTAYLVDEQNPTGYSQVMEERAGLNVTTHVFARGVVATVAGGSASYLVSDGQGSVRVEVNATGSATGGAGFDAFGVASGGTEAVGVHGYVGERWDGALETSEMRARMYPPETARFLSQDPFLGRKWEPGSLQRYAYCGSDPINFRDPSGRDPVASVLDNVLSIGTALPSLGSSLSSWFRLADRKFLSLSAVVFRGGRSNAFAADVARANAIWQEANIQFLQVGEPVLLDPVDAGGGRKRASGGPFSVNQEDESLLDAMQQALSVAERANVVVVYVRLLDEGSTGGFSSLAGRNGLYRNVAFIHRNSLPGETTLAHELGHVLGLENTLLFSDKGNLMYGSEDANARAGLAGTALTLTDKRTARLHAHYLGQHWTR